VATVNAVIADLTSKSKRTRKFSLSTMTMGSAFILGPYLSGKWMALLESPVKTGIYIFGLASFISCLSFLITKLFFRWEEKGPLCLPSSPFALLKEVASVLKQSPNLKLLFTAVFALYFGWYSFIKFFQVFLIQQMELDQKAYCNVLSYFGFCCLASQLLFYLIFSKVLKERVSLRLFPILLGAAILSFLFIHDYYALIVAVTLFALSYSLISPSLNSVISQHGSLSTHGKIMGMSQSVQSLAKLLSPGIAGAMMATSLYSPIVVSCILITLTSALFAFASPKASATTQIDSRS
jgi:DHA1 family tetracycline resistance protein-like MFS transporter